MDCNVTTEQSEVNINNKTLDTLLLLTERLWTIKE